MSKKTIEYEVQFKGRETDGWQPVSNDVLRNRLSGHYMNVNVAVAAIDAGNTLQTVFARYRAVDPERYGVTCAWCKKVCARASHADSHGICPECSAKETAKLDARKTETRA